MSTAGKSSDGTITLAEMREFASFPSSTQRYIRRSLDVAFHRADAMELWCRDVVEAASIRAQCRIYERIQDLRSRVPDDSGLDQVEPFMAPLIGMSAFDLGQDRLTSFPPIVFFMSACSEPVHGRGCPGRFAPPLACRTCTRTSAAPCSNRSAKRPRPPLAGPTASRASTLNGWRRWTPARRPIRVPGGADDRRDPSTRTL